MRNRNIAILSLDLIVLILGLKAALSFARFAKVERNFSSVAIGQSRDSVVGRLGRPNYYSGKCGVIHNPPQNCTVEYVYGHPFSPLVPEYYIVSFSGDGQVIQADTWMSP